MVRDKISFTAIAAMATLVLVVLAASPAAAQAEPATLGQVVDNARGWVMGLLAGLATLFFVIGGARYVMAGGDPSQVERAKLTLKSALAGYALALLAPVVLSVLRGIVGG
ncbi:MAG TPA: hypothetical protein VNA57_08005 [Acidimicrobiales bacterium]|nr:hypothetical protein [Acidimicrobiales bacterium]